MSLPTSMHGVQVAKTGGVEVLDYRADLPVPEPKDEEILVKNEYAGVNFIDTYFRTGLYKAALPTLLGREASGTVAKVGASVTTVKPGDTVVYMHEQAYANYSTVPVAKVVKVPAGVSTQQAAAVFLQGLTAWTFVREAGQVKAGQWVVVHAAAGGVGGLLVQLLAAVGAKVIGTASSKDKCELARKYGAGWVVQSRDEDIVARVNEITGGHGADVIFDGIGKATFDLDLQMVARKGTVVCFGNASGAVPPFDILKLGPKNVRVLRPIVNGYVSTPEELEQYASELFQMVIDGKLIVGIHKTYDLKDVASAHTDLESRGTTGKLVLKVDG